MKQFVRGITTSIALQLMGLALLLIFPVILWRTVRVLIPNGMGIRDREFFAFGWTDAFFRSWYNKIATDYRECGRFGYAWDDGLGLALGPRIYNNWITYWLLDKLGTRKMMALGYTFFLSVITFMIFVHIGAIEAIVITLILAASPVVISSYTHYGKPEMFWWGLGCIGIYAGFSGYYLLAGILWSMIAFANVPVAIILGVVIGPGLLWDTTQKGTSLLLLAGLFPGALKIFIRAYQMWRSGFMADLVSEQTGLWKRSWFDIGSEIILFAPMLVAIYIATEGHPGIPVLMVISLLFIMYYLNWRVIYMNDQQSFEIFTLIFSIVITVKSGNVLSILVVIISAYKLISIPVCGGPSLTAALEKKGVYSLIKMIFKTLSKYPCFYVLKKPEYEEPIIGKLFSGLPLHSRIISETWGRPREAGDIRNFWEWSKSYLVNKKVALVNDIYGSAFEPDLGMKYLNTYNVKEHSAETLINVADKLGVMYAVVFTNETREALLKFGAEIVNSINSYEINNSAHQKLIPKFVKNINLLKLPVTEGVVFPNTSTTFINNKLKVWVQKGCEYKVKYRYAPKIKAEIEGYNQNISWYLPFNDCDLKYIRLWPLKTGWLVIN